MNKALSILCILITLFFLSTLVRAATIQEIAELQKASEESAEIARELMSNWLEKYEECVGGT